MYCQNLLLKFIYKVYYTCTTKINILTGVIYPKTSPVNRLRVVLEK